MNSSKNEKSKLLPVPQSLLLLACMVTSGIYSQVGHYKMTASILCVAVVLLAGERVLMSLGLKTMALFFSEKAKH